MTLLKKPMRFAPFIGFVAIGLWLLLRLTLWAQVDIVQLNFSEAIGMLLHGLWFDLAALSYLIAPWLLISALTPNRWRVQPWFNKVRYGLAFVILFALVFGVISEFIFWQEFTTRFNFIAVDYLVYTHEVIGNIIESYPVPTILLAIAIFVSLLLWLFNRYIRFDDSTCSRETRTKHLAVAIALPLLSTQFVNVDQMAFSNNAYANELAGNGLFSFSAAARRNELDYEKFYKTIPQTVANTILKQNGVARYTGSQTLATAPNEKIFLGPFKHRPKNVILVSVESLSAEYLGIYGNKQNLTPYLDQLAKESLTFDNTFATGTRTVRGLDALSIAIPPIPGQAVVHRPQNAHLATIGEFLKAQHYNTFFIYGGYGVFDNMNNYFRANDYQVIDRTDFEKNSIQAENVWGVDDESLYINAIKAIDKATTSQTPFFVHIMTTSNHRPFTFPKDKIDLPQGHREGAVKYTDYAIKKLIENAKTKPWFKDTLFVIVADHCASVAGKTKLPVDKYRIPLFFYAPDILPAGHYQRIVSQIDIVPTLMDLLGVKGSQHGFGQSIFVAEQDKMPERAFISNYQELGYYKNDTLIALSPKQKVEAYRVDKTTFESVPTKVDTTLRDEAIAYYQTASRAFKLGELAKDRNPN